MDDVEQIVAAARAHDPSIEPVAGAGLATDCLEILAKHPDADAAEVARRCVARHPEADASWAAHIARAAVGEAPGL